MTLAMMKPQVMKLTNTMSVRINRLMLASRTRRVGTSGLQSSVNPTRWSTARDQISHSLVNIVIFCACYLCLNELHECLCRKIYGHMLHNSWSLGARGYLCWRWTWVCMPSINIRRNSIKCNYFLKVFLTNSACWCNNTCCTYWHCNCPPSLCMISSHSFRVRRLTFLFFFSDM